MSQSQLPVIAVKEEARSEKQRCKNSTRLQTSQPVRPGLGWRRDGEDRPETRDHRIWEKRSGERIRSNWDPPISTTAGQRKRKLKSRFIWIPCRNHLFRISGSAVGLSFLDLQLIPLLLHSASILLFAARGSYAAGIEMGNVQLVSCREYCPWTKRTRTGGDRSVCV